MLILHGRQDLLRQHAMRKRSMACYAPRRQIITRSWHILLLDVEHEQVRRMSWPL